MLSGIYLTNSHVFTLEDYLYLWFCKVLISNEEKAFIHCRCYHLGNTRCNPLYQGDQCLSNSGIGKHMVAVADYGWGLIRFLPDVPQDSEQVL